MFRQYVEPVVDDLNRAFRDIGAKYNLDAIELLMCVTEAMEDLRVGRVQMVLENLDERYNGSDRDSDAHPG